VGHPKIFQQLLVGGRFLERRQIRPLQVLYQRLGKRGGIVAGANHRRDFCQAGPTRRPPASFTGNEGVAALRITSEHHWLENSDHRDGIR
jgi:hypothetical protein